jgi:hypothetical protein
MPLRHLAAHRNPNRTKTPEEITMSKLSTVALIAVLALGFVATGTAAQADQVLRSGPPPTSPGTGDGDNGGICVAACYTLPPRHVAPPATVNVLAACTEKLTQLRRVTVGDVRRIGSDDVVHLVPLCDSVGKSLTAVETQYLDRGNVMGLLPTIGANPVLMSELDDRGYAANDVLGIALGPNAAILYVHRQ